LVENGRGSGEGCLETHSRGDRKGEPEAETESEAQAKELEGFPKFAVLHNKYLEGKRGVGEVTGAKKGGGGRGREKKWGRESSLGVRRFVRSERVQREGGDERGREEQTPQLAKGGARKRS